MATSKKPSRGNKTTGNNKTSAPRVIKGGTKSTDNTKGNYWKSIDPVIPIIQVDWKRPDGKDDAPNKYGRKLKGAKKSTPKNNWF